MRGESLADARADLGAQVIDRQAQLGDDARELIADALQALARAGVGPRSECVVDKEAETGDLLRDPVVDLAREAASLLQSREVAHLVEDAGGVQAQRRLICHGLRLGEGLDRPQAPGAFDADETDALVTEPKGDDGAGARRP